MQTTSAQAKPSTEKSTRHKGVKTVSTLTGRDAVNQPAPTLATRKLPSGSLQDYQILLLFHPTTLQPYNPLPTKNEVTFILNTRLLSLLYSTICFITTTLSFHPPSTHHSHTHSPFFPFPRSNPRNQFNFTFYMFPNIGNSN